MRRLDLLYIPICEEDKWKINMIDEIIEFREGKVEIPKFTIDE